MLEDIDKKTASMKLLRLTLLMFTIQYQGTFAQNNRTKPSPNDKDSTTSLTSSFERILPGQIRDAKSPRVNLKDWTEHMKWTAQQNNSKGNEDVTAEKSNYYDENKTLDKNSSLQYGWLFTEVENRTESPEFLFKIRKDVVLKSDVRTLSLDMKSSFNITLGVVYRETAKVVNQCPVVEYKCSGQCPSGRQTECSCEPSCQVLDNCCQGYSKVCVQAESNQAQTMCVDNQVVIASCPENYAMMNDTLVAPSVQTILKELDFDQLIENCNSTQKFLHNIPVLDVVQYRYYKNVFCAVCNSATSLEFWDGYLYCNEPPVLEQSHPLRLRRMFMSNLKGKFTRCQALLQPRRGVQQLCFKSDPGNEPATFPLAVTGIANLKLVLHPAYTHVSWFRIDGGMEILMNMTADDSALDNIVHVETIGDLSALQARCNVISLYVAICRECLIQYNRFLCPRVAREDFVNPCYSKVSFSYNVVSNFFTIQTTPVVQNGVEKYPDDKEDVLAFQVKIDLDYTFHTSRAIRGNVQLQMDKYTQLLSSAVTNTSLDNISCYLSYADTVKRKKSHQHKTYIQFKCQDNSDKDGNITAADQPKLSSDEVIRDGRVTRMLAFVENRVGVLRESNSIVFMPLTLHCYICVVLPQKKSSNAMCTQTEIQWSAVRNNHALLEGVSLEGMISIICCVLSIIGLLFRLAFQNIVTVYKSYPGKIQFSLCCSLLFSYAFFLIGGMVAEGSVECRVIGIVTHLFFLSSLFWMNVTAFEICRTFRHWTHKVVSRSNTGLLLSAVYAIGVPLIIVACAVLMEELLPMSELSPEYGVVNCWLNGSLAVAVYFVIPCSVLCCSNVVFIGLTLRGLRRQRTSISEFKFSSSMTAVSDTTIVVKISLLVGITWLLGLLAVAVDRQALWIIFTVINASLGLFISGVLVLNKRVYQSVRTRCQCRNTDSVMSTQVPKH